MTPNDRFTVRGSRWDWDNPFMQGAGRPSVERGGADQERDQHRRHLVEGVERHARCRKSRVGYNNFDVANNCRSPGRTRVEYVFPSA